MPELLQEAKRQSSFSGEAAPSAKNVPPSNILTDRTSIPITSVAIKNRDGRRVFVTKAPAMIAAIGQKAANALLIEAHKNVRFGQPVTSHQTGNTIKSVSQHRLQQEEGTDIIDQVFNPHTATHVQRRTLIASTVTDGDNATALPRMEDRPPGPGEPGYKKADYDRWYFDKHLGLGEGWTASLGKGGQGRRGGGGENKPVGEGQGGDPEQLKYWSEEYHKALAKRGELLREVGELKRRGKSEAARKKLTEVKRAGESVEYYRIQRLRAMGKSEEEIERLERGRSEAIEEVRDTTAADLDRISELKDKKQRKGGLDGKDLKEWNKLKGEYGGAIDFGEEK